VAEPKFWLGARLKNRVEQKLIKNIK